jgi:hypothetical protein
MFFIGFTKYFMAKKQKKTKKRMSLPKLPKVRTTRSPFPELERMAELYNKFKEQDANEEDLAEYQFLVNMMTEKHVPLVTMMVQAGLFTSFCWDNNERVAGFDVDAVTAEADKGFGLHSQQILFHSTPGPKYDFDDMGLDLSKIKFDKRNPN